MADERKVLDRTLSKALSGKDAHIENASVLGGLSWTLAGARPHDAPHSVFQLVNHMTYWLEWGVKWLDGKRPRPPKHAAGGWPDGVRPANREAWARTVRRFRTALAALERRSREADPLARGGTMTRLELLHLVASHTSYHTGQVAFLRQMLGAWPPPSGGVTW